MNILTVLGIIGVIFVGYRFVKGLGNTIPVMELMLLFAGLQWIIGPVIEYSVPSFHYRYKMYVNESIYMGYIVPAYLSFTILIIIVLNRKNRFELPFINLSNYSKFGLKVFFIGVFFNLFSSVILPSSLSFFGYILSNFMYVGSIILFFSTDRNLRIIFFLSLAYLLYTSIQNALFHDFILWLIFFYMFWAAKFKPSIKNILITFLCGFFLLATVQTVKKVYRTESINKNSSGKIELFFFLMVESIFVNDFFELSKEIKSSNSNVNVRLNQGWIISSVLDNIPENQEYLNGQTISKAVISSIVPRFLMADKEVAGGRKNFKLFTGLEIGDSTSMGISIIGEAYGNYGKFGGLIFMVVWGFFLSVTWGKLFNFFFDNIVFIAFIPLIFLQVVKSETELVVVLNHLIKSVIVVLLFFWFAKKYNLVRVD
jgi:hypothetical protein